MSDRPAPLADDEGGSARPSADVGPAAEASAPVAAPASADDSTQNAVSPSWAGKAGPLTWLIWIVSGLLFAILIWQGISSLFFPSAWLIAVRETNVWAFLLATVGGILVPFVCAILAIWMGRNRGIGLRALLLLTALAVSPAIAMTLKWLAVLL